MGSISFQRVVHSPEVIHSTRENITVNLDYEGVPLQLCCRLLDCGLSDRRERMYFDHPQPPFTRLFIFETGGAELEIPTGLYELEPGKIHLLPSSQPFKVSYRVSRLIYFHLHICDISGKSLFDNITGIPTLDKPELYRRVAEAMAAGDKFALLCFLMDVIRLFLSPRLKELTDAANRLRKFSLLFDYLHSMPPARVNLKELADLYRIPPDTLSKRFRRAVGMPLKHYLTEHQLCCARELLLHSDYSVSAIAQTLGYSTSQYFHRFFLKHCRVTPDQYRRRHIKTE